MIDKEPDGDVEVVYVIDVEGQSIYGGGAISNSFGEKDCIFWVRDFYNNFYIFSLENEKVFDNLD